MQIHDRIIGILSIIGGIAVIIGTLGFHEIPGQQFGSAFFPRILGAAMVLAGVTFLLGNASKRKYIEFSDIIKGRSGLLVFAVLCAVVLWVWLSPLLGFIASTTLLIAALSVFSGGSLIASTATAIGMSLLLFGVFGLLLRVPLPFGFIEALLT